MIPTKEKLEDLCGEFADDKVELAATRLERECAKLDPCEEQALAEIGVNADLAEWPEY
jgi:hypothetical protein